MFFFVSVSGFRSTDISSMDDGRIFLEIVIDSVAKVIETKLNTNVTKVQRRVNKYVAKYHN